MAFCCDSLRLSFINSSRGLEIFQAWPSESIFFSAAPRIISLKGREPIDHRATYSRAIVDKLQIWNIYYIHQNQVRTKWEKFMSLNKREHQYLKQIPRTRKRTVSIVPNKVRLFTTIPRNLSCSDMDQQLFDAVTLPLHVGFSPLELDM